MAFLNRLATATSASKQEKNWDNAADINKGLSKERFTPHRWHFPSRQ